MHYPEGSALKPVCDWKYFRTFWKDNFPNMNIRPPSHDTCAKCWKYRNELGVVSRLQNKVSRCQVCENFDATSALVNNEKKLLDGEDSDNDVSANNNNNNVESYSADMIEESIEGLCPPFVRDVETIVSKFKLHVDQYLNMRKFVKEKLSYQENTSQQVKNGKVKKLCRFLTLHKILIYLTLEVSSLVTFTTFCLLVFISLVLFHLTKRRILCSVNIIPKAKEQKEAIMLLQCCGTI